MDGSETDGIKMSQNGLRLRSLTILAIAVLIPTKHTMARQVPVYRFIEDFLT